MSAAGAPIFLLDTGGQIALWNAAMAALTGIAESRAVGRLLPELFSEDEQRENWRKVLRQLSGHTASLEIRSYWPKSSGSVVPLTCKLLLLQMADNGGAAVFGTVIDSEFASNRAAIFQTMAADRAALRGELSRFVHDTLSQDLVQLSFLVDRLSEGNQEFGGSGGKYARQVVERCCSGVRVLSSMLAAPPQGLAFQIWAHDNAVLLGEELGIEIATDLTDEQLPGDVNLLLGTAVHIWFGKAIRMAPPAAVKIRCQMDVQQVLLEMSSTQSALPGAASGWLMIEKTAEGVGGSFEMRHAEDGTSASLRVPLTW